MEGWSLHALHPQCPHQLPQGNLPDIATEPWPALGRNKLLARLTLSKEPKRGDDYLLNPFFLRKQVNWGPRSQSVCQRETRRMEVDNVSWWQVFWEASKVMSKASGDLDRTPKCCLLFFFVGWGRRGAGCVLCGVQNDSESKKPILSIPTNLSLREFWNSASRFDSGFPRADSRSFSTFLCLYFLSIK